MNLQQIEYILAVAELKNFSLAAEKCYITQSTLSTMICKFEDETGIKIFDRKTKPVSVTKEGEEIIRQLKNIAKEIDALNETVQNIKGELSGELKVGIIPTVAPFILPEFLNGFAKKFPGINISVSEMTTENIIESIKRRDLDIGILAIPLDDKMIKEIALYNEPFVLYDCSNKYKPEYADINKIEFDKFWLLSEGHCLNTQVKRICDLENKENITGINFDFKAGSIESLVRFVRKNKGMTLLPYLATLDFPKRERNKITNFHSPVPVRTIGLAVHKHFVKTRILELLQTEIKDKIIPLLNFEKHDEFIVSPV